jgi:hypothetical protein
VDGLAVTGHFDSSRPLRWVISDSIGIIGGLLKKAADGAGEQQELFGKSNRIAHSRFEREQDQKNLKWMEKITRYARLPEAHRSCAN